MKITNIEKANELLRKLDYYNDIMSRLRDITPETEVALALYNKHGHLYSKMGIKSQDSKIFLSIFTEWLRDIIKKTEQDIDNLQMMDNMETINIDNEETAINVLGLKSGKISISDIKSAYREMISKYHPDKVEHLGEEIKKVSLNKTKQINAAYNYLQSRYNF